MINVVHVANVSAGNIQEYMKWDTMRVAIEYRVYLRLFGHLNNTICRHITLYTILLLWPATEWTIHSRHHDDEDENAEKMQHKEKKNGNNNGNDNETVQSAYSNHVKSISQNNQHNYKLKNFPIKIEKQFGRSERCDDRHNIETLFGRNICMWMILHTLFNLFYNNIMPCKQEKKEKQQ